MFIEFRKNTDWAINPVGFAFCITLGILSSAELSSAQETYQDITICEEDTLQDLRTRVRDFIDQGQYTEAVVFYQMALTHTKNKFGEFHPNYSRCLSELGVLYSDMNEIAKAEDALKQAAVIDRQVLGPYHEQYSYNLHLLAQFYHDQGRNEEAEKLLIELFENTAKDTGAESYSTAERAIALGKFYYLTQQTEKAQQRFEQAEKIAKISVGELTSAYVRVLHDLNDFYQLTNQPEKAEPLLLRMIELEDALNSADPKLQMLLRAQNQDELAYVYREMAQFNKAETYAKKALAAHKTHEGKESLNYAILSLALAEIYFQTDRRAASAMLYAEAIKTLENSLGSDDRLVKDLKAHYPMLK